MISDALAGKRIAITGSTGFLGTALVERLLRCAPDTELVLLIRPGRRSTPTRRFEREILRNDAFDRLRADLGDSFKDLNSRVTAIAGDVATEGLGLDDEGCAAVASCDIFIHSAATVSFDSPLDTAVDVNLMGPVNIVRALQDLNVSPHLVAVSTCYVAGSRRGKAPEQLVSESPFFVNVDWRTEVAQSHRARRDAEAQSRTPESLTKFRAAARAELGAAGPPLLADKTEQRRNRWVQDRMVEAGRSRAANLGYPDAYAFTKALGELAMVETIANPPNETTSDIDASIVRPAIIESAWSEPKPGWIRGFRMAEPVIISYAKGLLSEFPGVPEGIIDVIPVDMVVGAICAVAADGPKPGTTPIVQVASGSSNPLRYRHLVDLVRDWFTDHPLYDERGQPIVVPDWTFPGRGRVQGQLERAMTMMNRSERLLHSLPLRGKQAAWSAKLDDKRNDAETALGYVELYGAYAECEALYAVDNLIALHEAMPPEDQELFGFDPRIIDWSTYVADIHLPSVVEQARVKTTPGAKKGESRSTRLRKQALNPDRQVAAFDLENTLIASNVVESYAWLATRRLPDADRLRFIAQTLAEAPALLKLDRRDRGDFLRYFYRRYEGASVEQLDEDAREMLSQMILLKAFPAGIRRVRAHKALGHRTVLITGALNFVVDPLRPLFDEIISAEMATETKVRRDGTTKEIYNGQLTSVPPTGEARAQVLWDFCDAYNLDANQAVAYADSSSDLPLLEAVGYPVAVNPETRLAAIARKRGWLVEIWSKSGGSPKPYLPIGRKHRSVTRQPAGAR